MGPNSIDDLIWMDTATKTNAAADDQRWAACRPMIARRRCPRPGPVTGGDTPYLQQQMFSLEALAKRDANDPFAKPRPTPVATPALGQATETAKALDLTELGRALRAKAYERWGRAA